MTPPDAPTPYGPLPGPGAPPPGRYAASRVPTATYRLQLQPAFPFAAAEEAVPYLARLGVSHLHLSPVLTAVPGSTHGYDVTDHTRVRAELGGEEGLRALSATARAHGLGLILDIVPNHMAVPADARLNVPLWEVLREGPGSAYAHWFDIDWEAGGGRVLLPVLGGPLGEELPRIGTEDDGAAAGRAAAGGRVLRYGDRVLPLRAGTAHLALPELLDAQHYRLAWWRLARTELNYRRFFTISDLIGIRVEDEDVFDATHAKVLELLRDGVADGLRVDHPDGLADPGGYLRRLHEAAEGRWTVVEKILGGDEALPGGWPVAGTTGYDALHRVDGVLTDPVGHAELAALYRDVTYAAPREGGEWDATAGAAAARVAARELAAETGRLVRSAVRVCEADTGPGLPLRDHSPAALLAALEQVLVRLPVYRPYAPPGAPGTPLRAEDAALLEGAAEGARRGCRSPEEARAVDVVLALALGRLGEGHGQRDFAARFAQVSSALRAKSVEDTAFYRYLPLASACEVGGEPGAPAVAPGAFHAYCARVQRDWPASATALSTHDTKRSADVRAAINVLTECPRRWAEFLREGRVTAVDGEAPDPHTAWTAWQTVLGLDGTPGAERLAGALLKSVREAGLRTTWTEQDEEYEAAVERFAATCCDAMGREAAASLVASLAPYVRANRLGAALLHLTMPGVPDLYQGTERTYTALVDPDNRRPVRFPEREEPEEGAAESEKLRLTAVALRLRRTHPEWFLGASASYEPLHAQGEAAGHCLAFVRSGAVVTAVTRLALRLHEAGGWRDTVLPLPVGRWRDLLTGRTVEGRCALARLFAEAPVALLVRAAAETKG